MAKAGAPSHVPTPIEREVVSNLSCVGWTHEKIAEAIGLTANTLRKHYKVELASAKGNRVAMVYGALYSNAVENNDVRAQIFLLRTQGGMKETQVNEHCGPDGEPLQFAPPVINVLFQNPPADEEGSE